MKVHTCPREQDVLELVAVDQWPARADAELRAHAAECQMCGDLAMVAADLSDLARATANDVSTPPASLVWYKAELRARREAAAKAASPVFVVQGIALACVVGLAAAWMGAGSTWFGGWLSWLGGLAPAMPAPDLASTTWSPAWLNAARGMGLAVLAGLVVASVAFSVARLVDE